MTKREVLKQQAKANITGFKSKMNDLKFIDVAKIAPNPLQPRKEFNEDSIKFLAESIKGYRLISPILVTEKDGKYTLVSGERRLRAMKLLKEDTIQCIILDKKQATDDNIKTIAIMENMQREKLSPWDEIEAIGTSCKKDDKPHQVAKKLSLGLEYTKRRLKAFDLIKKLKLTDTALTITEILAKEVKKKIIKDTKNNLSFGNLNKTEINEDLSVSDLNSSKNLSMEEMETQGIKDEKKHIKKTYKENTNNDLIEQNINKNDIVKKEKLINEEKELINFFSNYKGDDNMIVTVLTNGELSVKGSKLIFNEIMAILSKDKK